MRIIAISGASVMINEITNHFGINPKKGGSPPSDNMIKKIGYKIFVGGVIIVLYEIADKIS